PGGRPAGHTARGPGPPPATPAATAPAAAPSAEEPPVALPRPNDQARPTDQTPPSHQAQRSHQARPSYQPPPSYQTRPAGQAPPTKPTPPAWDPLGVAPFAWDLPEPARDEPPPPHQPRRRSPVTPLTIGLALVTAGVGTFAATYNSFLTAPRILAMVLAVFGGGLVVGSFVRGGRGLIPLAIPLAAI